nr:protein pim1 [Quercus suber]
MKKRPAEDTQGPIPTRRAKAPAATELRAQANSPKKVSAAQRTQATAKIKTKGKANVSGRELSTTFPLNSRPAEKLRIFVFGEGSAGELGLGSKNATDVASPRLNPNLNGVVNLATGGMHAVALTVDGKVLTWGVNDNHALGRETAWDGGMRDAADDSGSDDGDLNPLEATPTAISPTVLPAGTEIVQVAAGDSTTFMLTRDGFVYGCGTFRDLNGKCRFSLNPTTGEEIEFQCVPSLVPNLEKITSISVGADFALALDHYGTVFAWGSGEQHQLGRRVVERRRLETLLPHKVQLPKKVKIVSIHAGIDHAFAIDATGDVWAWGLNNFGQTGIASAAGSEDATVITPTKAPALAGRQMRVVDGGRHHSIGVTAAGECLVWGRMDGAQMGVDVSQLPLDDPTSVVVDDRGKPRILLQPTALPIPKCTHATAGPDHCLAVTQDGKAYSWGFNVNSQCGQGTDDDVLVAKLMNGKAVRDVKICWAGAGGQYSMLAAELE